MLEPSNNNELPVIPGKRYFTIGEVAELCDVKPHVYYQRHDVLLIRQIRSLLYDEGFTIGGARQRLEGEGNKDDVSQSQQIIRQTLIELEELLTLLKR
jgi:DNA-binding transcriptional MerR regulator